jgi:hypothetical protein
LNYLEEGGGGLGSNPLGRIASIELVGLIDGAGTLIERIKTAEISNFDSVQTGTPVERLTKLEVGLNLNPRQCLERIAVIEHTGMGEVTGPGIATLMERVKKAETCIFGLEAEPGNPIDRIKTLEAGLDIVFLDSTAEFIPDEAPEASASEAKTKKKGGFFGLGGKQQPTPPAPAPAPPAPAPASAPSGNSISSRERDREIATGLSIKELRMHLRGHSVLEAKIQVVKGMCTKVCKYILVQKSSVIAYVCSDCQGCVEKRELVELLLSCNEYDEAPAPAPAYAPPAPAPATAAAAVPAPAPESAVDPRQAPEVAPPTPFERIAVIEAADMGGMKEGTLADRIRDAELALVAFEGRRFVCFPKKIEEQIAFSKPAHTKTKLAIWTARCRHPRAQVATA